MAGHAPTISASALVAGARMHSSGRGVGGIISSSGGSSSSSSHAVPFRQETVGGAFGHAGGGSSSSGGGGAHAERGILARLGSAVGMVDYVAGELQRHIRRTRAVNRRIACAYDPDNTVHSQSFAAEHALLATYRALRAARPRVSDATSVHDIPEMLLGTLYAARMSGARLRGIAPECSDVLSEASVQLGCVILDAATISGSKLDLGRSNADASRLFDQAKLTADSKLRKQYPKLDILGICNRCY